MNTVSTLVPLRMFAHGREAELTATFGYDISEPYEVRVTFHAGLADQAEWVFARSLLSAGVNGPTGSGDVRVWPHDYGILNIALTSPHGAARFEAPAASVARFLDITRLLVPEGTEPARTDLDAGIAAILAEGGTR